MRGRFNRIIFEWSRYRELPRRKRIVSKWSIGVGVVGGSGLWSTKGKVTGVDSCGIVGTMLECFMRDWPPPYGRGNDPLFRKLNYHVASNNFLPSPSILLRRFFPFFIADFSFRSRLSIIFPSRIRGQFNRFVFTTSRHYESHIIKNAIENFYSNLTRKKERNVLWIDPWESILSSWNIYLDE